MTSTETFKFILSSCLHYKCVYSTNNLSYFTFLFLDIPYISLTFDKSEIAYLSSRIYSLQDERSTLYWQLTVRRRTRVLSRLIASKHKRGALSCDPLRRRFVESVLDGVVAPLH